MGANFQTMQVAGETARDEVKKIFAEAQDQDRYENGGGFGMASGLKFASKTFDSETEASDWLDENAQKLEDAIAVRFKDENGKAQWMIGAICAS